MKVKDLLDSENKWAKRCYKHRVDSGYKYCLVGAIHECYPEEMWESILVKIANEIQCCVTFWNDQDKTTFDDILRLINLLNI